MNSASRTKNKHQRRANIVGQIRQLAESDTFPTEPIQPLLLCPRCNVEMGLLGVESNTETRDLYTFECHVCGGFEVRGVRVR